MFIFGRVGRRTFVACVGGVSCCRSGEIAGQGTADSWALFSESYRWQVAHERYVEWFNKQNSLHIKMVVCQEQQEYLCSPALVGDTGPVWQLIKWVRGGSACNAVPLARDRNGVVRETVEAPQGRVAGAFRCMICGQMSLYGGVEDFISGMLRDIPVVVSDFSSGKASGIDEIPTEVPTEGGQPLVHGLSSLIWQVCGRRQAPRTWCDGDM